MKAALFHTSQTRVDPDRGINLCILPTKLQPTGILWQSGPLLWVHPRVSPANSVEHYPTAVALLALQGLQACLQRFGTYPESLIVPYNAGQVRVLGATVDDWAIFICSFPERIDCHFPKHPLLNFFTQHPVIFPKVTSSTPLPGAAIIFTDGSKTGRGVYMINNENPVVHQYPPGAPQQVELAITLEVFWACPFPFNLVSDSLYVVNALRILECAGPIWASIPVYELFSQIQGELWRRKTPFFVQNICAHSGLPGPLAAGNSRVDTITHQALVLFSTSLEKAYDFHREFHVNAKNLQQKFSLAQAEA